MDSEDMLPFELNTRLCTKDHIRIKLRELPAVYFYVLIPDFGSRPICDCTDSADADAMSAFVYDTMSINAKVIHLPRKNPKVRHSMRAEVCISAFVRAFRYSRHGLHFKDSS
jgi:hypothetical protein